MIVLIDSSKPVYLYAQELDNSGNSICLSSSVSGEYQDVSASSSQRDEILYFLDQVQRSGRRWWISSQEMECITTFYGDCLVKLNPVTRDCVGRVAPIVVLFNVRSAFRSIVGRVLLDSEKFTSRVCSSEQRAQIFRLQKMLNFHWLFISVHIIFFSRKRSND
jgi:hypothetical protein